MGATLIKFRGMPTDAQLSSIPLARAGEYDLNEKEVITLRRRIYSLNKDGFVRYRTMRQGRLLMVWRIK